MRKSIFIGMAILCCLTSGCVSSKKTKVLKVRRIDTYPGTPRIYSTDIAPVNAKRYYLSGFYSGKFKTATDSVFTNKPWDFRGFVLKRDANEIPLIVSYEEDIMDMQRYDGAVYLSTAGRSGPESFIKTDAGLNLLWERNLYAGWPDPFFFSVNNGGSLYLINYADTVKLDNGVILHHPFGKGRTSTILKLSENGEIKGHSTKNLLGVAFARALLDRDHNYYLVHGYDPTTVLKYNQQDSLLWMTIVEGRFNDAILDKYGRVKMITSDYHQTDDGYKLSLYLSGIGKNGQIVSQSQLHGLDDKQFNHLKILSADKNKFSFSYNSEINEGRNDNDFTPYTFSISVATVDLRNQQLLVDTISVRNASDQYAIRKKKEAIFLTGRYFDDSTVNGTMIGPVAPKVISSFVAIFERR